MIEIFRGPPGSQLIIADSCTLRLYLPPVYLGESCFVLFGHKLPYNRGTQNLKFQLLVQIFAARGAINDVIKFKYANSTSTFNNESNHIQFMGVSAIFSQKFFMYILIRDSSQSILVNIQVCIRLYMEHAVIWLFCYDIVIKLPNQLSYSFIYAYIRSLHRHTKFSFNIPIGSIFFRFWLEISHCAGGGANF